MRLSRVGIAAAELSLVLAVASERRQADESSSDVASERRCYWGRPQTALIRDTIYIDGGDVAWLRIGKDGFLTTNEEFTEGYRPILYSVKLTQPYSHDAILANESTVIHNNPRQQGNFAPGVTNGHLLANDYGFILYGGLMIDTDAYQVPDSHWALAKDIYKHGAIPLPDPGRWRSVEMSGITRNVAGGAYVNIPSEDLAFVYGGSRSQTWDQVRSSNPPRKNEPSALSDQLISVDLKLQSDEKWANDTARDIAARSSGELVWLPVGKKGALVTLGGTVVDLNATFSLDESLIAKYEPRLTRMKNQGQQFMDEVNLYDVDRKEWYTQATSGDIPPPTAEFCSVVASSEDGSSHQIYAYGGYDGLAFWGYSGRKPDQPIPMDNNYDHVYVLSIPSFIWTKVYDGESNRARRGHRCHRISDDKMMVLGGVGSRSTCISGEFLRVFNLNTLKFEEGYNPENHDTYKVPSIISAKIGGDESGGADKMPSKWTSDDLRDLVTAKYSKSVKNYWPFKAESETDSSDPSATSDAAASDNDGSSLPSYVPPLLGAILGLLVVITILCAVLFWLRRRKRRRQLFSDSGASTVIKKRQTWSWLMGVNADDKESEYYSEPSGGLVKGPLDGITAARTPAYERPNPVEAPSDAVIHEMPDTGLVGELAAPHMQRRVTISDNPHTVVPPPLRPQSPPTSPTSPLLISRVESMTVSPISREE